jgi:tetratricopeptide (TPR) repeat protein
MAATNLLLGYWMHLLAIVVVGLLAVLVWGQYGSWVQNQQRQISSQIADVERTLPAALPDLADKVAAGEVKPEDLVDPAAKIEGIGLGAKGAGAAEALLKSAELYRLAGKPDKQREALEAAAKSAGKNVLGYAAGASLANLDFQEGKTDDAIRRFTELRDTFSGVLAQNASLDLALSLEHLGRKDEARRVYDEFIQKWPDSPHVDQVQGRIKSLGDAAPSVPPVVAPGDAPVVAPTDAPVVAPTDAPAAAPVVAPGNAPAGGPG